MVCLLYYFLYIPGRELRLPLVQQDLLKRDGGHTGKWVCGESEAGNRAGSSYGYDNR